MKNGAAIALDRDGFVVDVNAAVEVVFYNNIKIKAVAKYNRIGTGYGEWLAISEAHALSGFKCRRSRIAGRALRHEAPAGSLAICPAGIDCAADAEESDDALLVAIHPGHLALAAAEDSALEAQLIERLSGYDQALLDLARTLALESADGYPNGPLFWNEVSSDFIDGLVTHHTSEFESRARGMLGKDVLERLRDMSLPT